MDGSSTVEDATIDRLERDVRRWRGAVLVLGMLLAATFSLGATRKMPDVLKLRSLVIVDEEGDQRIVARSEGGHTSLVFIGRDQKPRISISATPEGDTLLALYDRDGKSRVVATTRPDGAATLELRDRDEKPRIIAGTTQEGDASLEHIDRDGNARIATGTFPGGQASILHYDLDGKVRISTATRKGISNIKLLDRYGKARFALGITRDEETAIGLRDRTGKYTWVEEAE